MSTKKRDYYAVLNLPKSATLDEIKSAYKNLVLKYHPDRHPNKTQSEKDELCNKFKEVSEAYQVLSDETKRAKYDRHGHDSEQGFVDAKDVFENIFGKGMFNAGSYFSGFTSTGFPGGFSNSHGGGNFYNNFNFSSAFDGKTGSKHADPCSTNRIKKERPVVEFKLGCTLDDLYSGCTKKLKITRSTRSGKAERVLEMKIKPGYKKGTKFNFPGEGDEMADGTFQDVKIVLEEKTDKSNYGNECLDVGEIKRNGDDLEVEVRVSLKEFLCGAVKTVKLPGCRVASLRVNQMRRVGDEVILKGFGMPVTKTGMTGNLKVRVAVENVLLSVKQIEEIKKIL